MPCYGQKTDCIVWVNLGGVLLIIEFLLHRDLGRSEKGGLDDAAAAKIKQITAELQITENGGSKDAFDPVQRIKAGFARFKTEKYLYVPPPLPIFAFPFFSGYKTDI